ncbi:PREDICTED: UPF0565 protein C2orf69 homolog [Dufourea novaeangliae]|uniref:UPF0565 protein C2orf69 like protein n=1 Tax=Dufourea novaeangliae TaxID=178035 RepID=A0A154PR73_DUFNO|nr:PREDICTED: UPF0565 protein C2orf69 homolog [Dufourea novaeangliae]KZC13778.1 UPF0565 protein C2orf69 like protein [Dufourea novaeangliae]
MPPKNWIWKKLPGITGRFNDIIYSSPISISPLNQDIFIYFGGDVQDLHKNMEQHADSKKYTEWSLENTAHILSTNFPNKHLLIIRPSRIHVTKNASFSCFDNFVPSNDYGVPSFCPTYNGLKHLQALVKSCLENIKTCNEDKGSIDFSSSNIKLSLMGFSKGCVVLNQFLQEFYYYNNKPDSDIEVTNFIKLIESMWWLDGGHGGSKDTWITNKHVLESFAKLKIEVHIQVTPYQVYDSYRPWIGEEENHFCNILLSLGVPVQRILHFADQKRSLELHFKVLNAIGSYNQ